MEDKNKSKAQLVSELKELRRQNKLLKNLNLHSTEKEWFAQNGDKLNSAIVEHSPLGISVRSSKGKLLSVNNAWKKIWNLSDEQVNDLMSKNPDKPNFKHTMDSLGEWLPKVKNIYKNGGLLNIPKLRLTDTQCDRSCWVSLTYYAINNEKGGIDRVVILTEDITERVILEKSAIESQSKYRSVIDNAIIGVLVLQNNRLVFCNSKMYEMFGYTEEDYSKIDFLSIVHPDDRPIAVERIKTRLSNPKNDLKPLEIRAICKSGEIKWIETNSTKIQWNNGPALQAFISDITERKQAEDALWESNERFQLLVENLDSIIVDFALDGTLKYCSPNVKELGGYDPQEEIGQHFSKYIADQSDLIRLQGFFEKVITGQKVEPFEFLYKPKKSKPFYAEAKARPVYNPDSNIPVSVSCIINDVSERKKAQEELKKSEEKYRALFDLSGDAIMLLGDEKFINCNQATLNLLRCPSEQEFCKLHPSDIFPKLQPCGTSSKLLIEKNMAKAIKNGSNRFEWMHNDLEGKEIPTEVMLSTVDLDGQPVIQAIIRDISERKQAEDAIKEKEYFLSESQKVARLGTYVHNVKTGIWSCSEVLNEIYGIPADYEKSDESWLQLVHPDDRKTMSDYYLKNVLGQKQPFNKEYRIVRYNDKKQRWVHGQSRLEFDVDGQPIRMIGTVQDITERKRTESALRESEEHYKNFFDNALVGIIRTKISDGTIIEINSKAATLIGLSPDEIVGKIKTSELYQNPNQREKLVAKLTQDGELYDEDIEMILPNGNEVTFSFSIKAYPEQDYLEGVVIDITERKLADEELRKLAEIVKYSSELVNMADLDGNMIFLNEAGGKILGINPEDVEKTNIMEVIPDNLIDTVKNELLTTLMNGELWEGNLQYKNIKTGKLTDVHTIAFTVNDPKTNKPQFLANVSLDITETKRLQEQESRAQRLESAGQIAGQIAHDFNNLLAPLVAYPDFIKEALPENHPAIKYINDMEKSANQIAEINQQLLTLSRRGHYNQEILNLNDIISLVLREIEILPQTLVVQTDLEPNLMNIKGGGAQIHRILTNLIFNACDAMQNVGNIVIKTENYYADNLTINYGYIPKGEYVKLTVSDIGCGIPENIKTKIFDPFFSTKTSDKKRGSGLGLSVVDTVIKDHHGYIDLKSTIGEGTSFFIYFPITRDRSNKAEENKITGGNESIIVIDDDKVQCNVALKILEKLGYNATAVNSGEKAVEYLKNNPRDLLLLDMIMPDGIDGTETYRQILEIYPDQKAIMVSGYAETSRVEEARKLGIDMYIRKPLTMKLLASCIRKVLDNKKESLITI